MYIVINNKNCNVISSLWVHAFTSLFIRVSHKAPLHLSFVSILLNKGIWIVQEFKVHFVTRHITCVTVSRPGNLNGTCFMDTWRNIKNAWSWQTKLRFCVWGTGDFYDFLYDRLLKSLASGWNLGVCLVTTRGLVFDQMEVAPRWYCWKVN